MADQQPRVAVVPNPATPAAPPKGPKEGRSPAYPAVDLGVALEKVGLLHKAEGKNFAHVSTVMQHLGYTAKSGSGRLVFAALRKFGLIETRGSGSQKSARVSDDAVRVLLDDRPKSDERRRLLQQAALRPNAHRLIWDHYKGTLPSDTELLYQLKVNRGFSGVGAIDFLEEFKKTLAFAQVDGATKVDPSRAQNDDDADDEDSEGESVSQCILERKDEQCGIGKTSKPQGAKPPVRFVITFGENALEITMRTQVSKAQFETIKQMIALAEATFVEPAAS